MASYLLTVQNLSVAICAVLLRKLGSFSPVPDFSSGSFSFLFWTIVIVAIVAALSSMALGIAITKDWIVELAKGDIPPRLPCNVLLSFCSFYFIFTLPINL